MTCAKSRFAAFLLPLAVAACSAPGGYPSLAIRDVERVSGSATPAEGTEATTPVALPPASADLLSRLEALVAAARTADGRFQSVRGTAERTVGASGSRGSDSWVSGSVALAQLETSRAQAMVALADLDRLYADARDAAPVEESPSATAIGEARRKVSDIVAGQDSVMARLGTRLGS